MIPAARIAERIGKLVKRILNAMQEEGTQINIGLMALEDVKTALYEMKIKSMIEEAAKPKE